MHFDVTISTMFSSKRAVGSICSRLRESNLLSMLRNLSLTIIILTSSSCGNYTYNGSITYFPSGATYENAKYILSVGADGERNKAYIHYGPKQVYIEIYDKSHRLLIERQKIIAANLKWVVHWDEVSNVKILFFDAEVGSNTIATVAVLTHLS